MRVVGGHREDNGHLYRSVHGHEVMGLLGNVEDPAVITAAIEQLKQSGFLLLAALKGDAEEVLERFDGWTVTVTPKGALFAITGEIEFRLNKPKA